MIRKRTIRSLVPVTAIAFNLASTMYGATTPSLSVNATAERHAISPYIYGIANGLDATFAEEIKLPNTRWGGDAASRYNWEQDSSNSGGDWYFTGGSGTSNPKAGASVDENDQYIQGRGHKVPGDHSDHPLREQDLRIQLQLSNKQVWSTERDEPLYSSIWRELRHRLHDEECSD